MSALIKVQGLVLDDVYGIGSQVDIERLLHGVDVQEAIGRGIARHNAGVQLARAPSRDLPFARRKGGVLLAQGSGVPVTPSGRPCTDLMACAADCRPYGAKPPEGCVDARGAIRPHMVCGMLLPYAGSSLASAATETYRLKARAWAQPLKWIDASGADIAITAAKYQGNSIWGTENVDVVPNSLFASGDNERHIPGLPAIGNTDGDALVFELVNNHASAAQKFTGAFIGVGVRP